MTTSNCRDPAHEASPVFPPRLNYWVVLNGQRVQYSGTESTAALKLTTDSPQRLAGSLAFDGARAGGPEVALEFDAPLLKEMAKAR